MKDTVLRKPRALDRDEYRRRIAYAKWLGNQGERLDKIAKMLEIDYDSIWKAVHGTAWAQIQPSPINPMPTLEAEEWIW